MLSKPNFTTVCLLAVLSAWGCARHSHGTHGVAQSNSASARLPVEELPAVERGAIAVDYDEPANPDGPTPPEFVETPHDYVALTAEECQRLAARHSALGNLLDGQRRNVCCRCQASKKGDSGACCVVTTLLDAAAREARNKNAADALRLYYGLAEVEAGLDTVDQSAKLVAELIKRVEEMHAAGLELAFDRSEFERQQLALGSKRSDLIIKRDELNTQLRSLLGYASPAGSPYFWPTDSLESSAVTLDAEAEVEYGLATRPQLVGLRRLPKCGCPDTADLLGVLTGESHGALRLFMALGKLDLLHGDDCCDPCALQRQLTRLGQGREQQIAGEIRTAVFAVGVRRGQADDAKTQVSSWKARVDELVKKQAIDEATFIDIGTAALKLLEAEQAAVAATLEIKRAEIDLAEHQGALEAQSGR